jgi:DNA mismatch endonuclease (patch repair protein)
MVDVFDKQTRSKIMSKIRSKNTEPEKLLFSALKKAKICFRKHSRMRGRPDAVIPKGKLVIFVDGDFWHGYKLRKRSVPMPDYWELKIRRNMARDKAVTKALRDMGWRVIRLWEHEMLKSVDKCVKKVLKAM